MDRFNDPDRFCELAGLIDKALTHLQSAGYGIGTRRTYRRLWKRFLEWVRETGEEEPLPALVARYQAHRGIDASAPGEQPSHAAARARGALKFLDGFGRHLCRWPAHEAKGRECTACVLDRLVEGATAEVLRLGYSESSRQKFSAIWCSFRRFAAKTAPGESFSRDLATRFLESRGIPEDHRGLALRSAQRYLRLAMLILAEFGSRGSCRRRRFRDRPIALDSHHEDALDRYLEFCRLHLRLRPGTTDLRRKELSRFLEFLGSRGVGPLHELKTRDLSSFVVTLTDFHPSSVSRIVSDVRGFLRHLCMRGVVTAELIDHLPSVRVPRDARIPSVWNPEDVDALLASVDRTSPVGKRDYAILLLACRLGLRGSDIRALRLEDIDWGRSVVRIAQRKTGTPLVQPLSDEVGEAIVDYLQSARPPSEHRQVFLKALPPFEPFPETNHLHRVVNDYRCRAGIRLPPRMRSGLHSLRHTLATRLLEAGTPFETISEILGHQTMESTRLYTKVDLPALRSVALDPDDLTGVGDE